MPTYYGSGSAEGKAIARFQYRNAELVTATATATATSTVSQADADSIAQKTAQQVATSQAENDRNIIVQSVNTATSNETTYGLESSFLGDSIKPTSSTSFELTKSYQVEDGKTLRIESNQTLTIGPGVLLSSGRGRIDNRGIVEVNGGSLEIGSNSLTATSENTGISFLTPSTVIDLSNNNSGTIDISNNGVAIVNPGVTFTNDASGGIISLSGGVLLNYGIIDNFGQIIGNAGDLSNNIINGVPRTINGTNYAPTQDVSFNNLGLIGSGNITTNSIGILNGDVNQNIFNINFVNSTTGTISISGIIGNNASFTNEDGVGNNVSCYSFSNSGNTYNYGELVTNIFGNVSISNLDISANFYNYGNLVIDGTFNVAELSNLSSTVYNTVSSTIPPSYGEITLENTVTTPIQFYGNLINNTDCSFNCLVNGFENYNNLTNRGYMLFGTANPPTTSLTNGNGAIISNPGEIYCGSFVNDPSGNVFGNSPIILT
jgi:hypothetical protein